MRIKAIYWPGKHGFRRVVGEDGCERLELEHAGDMFPGWIRELLADGRVGFHNTAHIETVVFEDAGAENKTNNEEGRA